MGFYGGHYDLSVGISYLFLAILGNYLIKVFVALVCFVNKSAVHVVELKLHCKEHLNASLVMYMRICLFV
jgi:hypothetical protein